MKEMYDVVVCGGGTAGAYAALSAAEEGASVLVVESSGSLGGSATNGLVLPVMSSHLKDKAQNSYLQKRLFHDMERYSQGLANDGYFDPIVLAFVEEQACVEAGVDLLYHTVITGVETEGSAVTGLRIFNKAGHGTVHGKMYIDCTGDADVCVYAGAEWTRGEPETGRNQAVSLRYMMGGVNIDALGTYFKQVAADHPDCPSSTASYNRQTGRIYAAVTQDGKWALNDVFLQAVAAGDLVDSDRWYWQLFHVPGRNDSIALNCPEFFDVNDSTDPESLSRVQVEGKKAIFRQVNFYRKYFPGFEHAYVSSIASMVGVRESRNVKTEYVLTASDVVTCRKFPDAICQSAYPMDVHGDSRFNIMALKRDVDKPWYELPFGSLVVRGLDNLLVAGRCLGADFCAQSSIRVQHSCRASGEAAGIGAAMAARSGCAAKEIDGAKVRALMVQKGADFCE